MRDNILVKGKGIKQVEDLISDWNYVLVFLYFGHNL